MIERVSKVMTGEGVLDLRSVLWIGVPALAIIVGLAIYIYQGDKARDEVTNGKQDNRIDTLNQNVGTLKTDVAAVQSDVRNVQQMLRDQNDWLRREFTDVKGR